MLEAPYGRRVGLTGVIYGAIVVAWAAYLVPLALRRHDEAARNRSIERFSSAMRVLARRGGTAETGRVVLAPGRDVDRILVPTLTPLAVLGPASAPRPSRRALRVAAARRRRVLVVLIALVVGTATCAGFRLLPMWIPAVPLVLVVAFLGLARRQVRRASEAYWTEVAEHRPEPHNVVRRAVARVDAITGSPTAGPEEPTEQLTPVLPAELVEERVVAVPVVAADGSSLWDPVPITLPTYVDKPVAAASPRTVDLGHLVAWSSGHSTEDSATVAEAASGQAASDEADEAPRAVNG